MSQNREPDVLEFIQNLRKEQAEVLATGANIDTIEKYRAGTATVRNLDRIAGHCKKIIDGQTAAEARDETALETMPDDKKGKQ